MERVNQAQWFRLTPLVLSESQHLSHFLSQLVGNTHCDVSFSPPLPDYCLISAYHILIWMSLSEIVKQEPLNILTAPTLLKVQRKSTLWLKKIQTMLTAWKFSKWNTKITTWLHAGRNFPKQSEAQKQTYISAERHQVDYECFWNTSAGHK